MTAATVNELPPEGRQDKRHRERPQKSAHRGLLRHRFVQQGTRTTAPEEARGTGGEHEIDDQTRSGDPLRAHGLGAKRREPRQPLRNELGRWGYVPIAPMPVGMQTCISLKDLFCGSAPLNRKRMGGVIEKEEALLIKLEPGF